MSSSGTENLLFVDPYIVNIHICLAVAAREIDGPAASRRQIEHEELGVFLARRLGWMPPHFDIITVVDRICGGDLAAVGMERFIPGRGNTNFVQRGRIMQCGIVRIALRLAGRGTSDSMLLCSHAPSVPSSQCRNPSELPLAVSSARASGSSIRLRWERSSST